MVNGDWLFLGRMGVTAVGKVCDLCRVLETDISVVLMVMSGLGILFD